MGALFRDNRMGSYEKKRLCLADAEGSVLDVCLENCAQLGLFSLFSLRCKLLKALDTIKHHSK